MNYQSIYDRLIAKFKDHPKVKCQTNDHHIIPKCFKKIDDIEDIDGQWNRVHLPHREHFIAHLLLARIWRGHRAKGPMMAKAFNRMSNCGWYTSKDYEWIKSSLNYSHSEETKQKLSEINIGKKMSKESCQKMSDSRKGKPIPKLVGRKSSVEKIQKQKDWYASLSDDEKQIMNQKKKDWYNSLSQEEKQVISEKISKRNKRPKTEKEKQATREAITKYWAENKHKDPRVGKPRSKETIEKIKETKRRKRLEKISDSKNN